MLELICKRLLLAIPTLLLVSMMVFGLQKLLRRSADCHGRGGARSGGDRPAAC